MNVFSEQEKAALRGHLESAVFRKAVSEALSSAYRARKGASGVEQSALAYHYHAGATDVLEALYGLADVKADKPPLPKRLHHDA